MGTLKVNSIAPAVPGSEDYYLVRAWVHLDQTGTQAIIASGNCGSIVDQGNGNTKMNFANAAPNAYYAFTGEANGATHNSRECISGAGGDNTTAGFPLVSIEGGVSTSDNSMFCMMAIW